MRKFVSLFACISLGLSLLGPTIQAAEDSVGIAQEAGYPATADIAPKGAIVLNAENGQILWQENPDILRDPASTTKTMVIYLTFEAIAQGKISLDTEVVATETDQAIGSIYALSNNKIVAGVTYTVRELLTMTLVPSSNVTTLMLAHLIHDGDDASFLELMNKTAQELGMTNTVFHNATGAIVSAFEGYYAPEGYDHTIPNDTTPKDLATLAYHLIKKYPEVLQFTNETVVTVKDGTPYEETFEAYNHSLPADPMGIEGVDGLKTGSSPSAGYNAIVTAQRGDTRLIVVVMGVSQWGDPEGEFVRHYFVNSLLEKNFADYERKVVAPAGQHEVDGKKVKTDEDLYGLVKKGQEAQLVINQNRLQVAGGIDPTAGVALTSSSEQGSDAGSASATISKKPISFLPILILVPILVAVLVLVFYLTKPAPRSRNRSRRDS